ncbi:hypothetical protein [Reyranella sp.]|uniref:hypothetical protein n=1 Tax=Reyranella sp. TaxID=1929291 RepID=UPI003C7A217B
MQRTQRSERAGERQGLHRPESSHRAERDSVTPPLSRRLFLGGMAALAAASALPAISTVEAATITTPPPAAPTPRTWGWGFWRNGDEIINGPYGSREEAIAAGKEHFADYLDPADGTYGFETCECDRHPVHHGDYHEDLINDLCEPGTDIAWSLQQSMEGSNCDNDFEGEVAEAIATVPWEKIAAAVVPVIWRAVERSGLFFVGSLIEEEFDGDCALMRALETDQMFKAELIATIHPMIEAAGVMDASNMLLDYDNETHIFPIEVVA